MKVVLLPGFNGAARQPLLVKVAKAFDSKACAFPGLPKGRPTPELSAEVEFLTKTIARRRLQNVAMVGRSFGGRVALRYATQTPVRALVLLGFPVRPKNLPRPLDEAALLAVNVPTLIVQGSDDELGPLEVLKPIIKKNRSLTLEVLEGAGHSFGRHESRAVSLAAAFLNEHV